MRTVAMEAPVPEDDALARIVSLADAEGLLRAGSLERFVEGLRERGRIILEGRVHRLERRLEELEKEVRWRIEVQEGLETENAWRRASMAALEQRIASLEEQQAWQAGEIERREAEARGCRQEQARAMAAHDRLLEHQRAILAKQAQTAAAHDRLLEHHRIVLAEEQRKIDARDEEAARLREEQSRAAAAHDRLLEHHRSVLKEVAEALTAVVSLLPWSYRRAKAALSRLAGDLRQGIP